MCTVLCLPRAATRYSCSLYAMRSPRITTRQHTNPNPRSPPRTSFSRPESTSSLMHRIERASSNYITNSPLQAARDSIKRSLLAFSSDTHASATSLPPQLGRSAITEHSRYLQLNSALEDAHTPSKNSTTFLEHFLPPTQ